MPQVMLAVVRLEEVSSDVVITLNTPISINPRSSSAKNSPAGPKGAHERAPGDFATMLHSFQVLKWGLFGPPAIPEDSSCKLE